jgi:hypothetical protein
LGPRLHLRHERALFGEEGCDGPPDAGLEASPVRPEVRYQQDDDRGKLGWVNDLRNDIGGLLYADLVVDIRPEDVGATVGSRIKRYRVERVDPSALT